MIKKLFAPGNDSLPASLALLALRLWLGLTMMLNHGLDKWRHFGAMSQNFFDPFHIGAAASLGLVVFAEVGAAAMLAAGLLGRLAAFILAFDMGTAFFLFHKRALGGPMSGELAFIYLGGFVTLLLAGPGKVSLDKIIFGKGK
ncbi:MAG: DoxX family protein [Verrucomicrobia bacterium]|nr:DoxX family protein [Verrucomicrobiota bacterium]MDE3099672.1 DoxX family protein [Verrucomicrobiota bacterium]